MGKHAKQVEPHPRLNSEYVAKVEGCTDHAFLAHELLKAQQLLMDFKSRDRMLCKIVKRQEKVTEKLEKEHEEAIEKLEKKHESEFDKLVFRHEQEFEEIDERQEKEMDAFDRDWEYLFDGDSDEEDE